MKKEVILAITIGFFIGLILTFIFYRSQIGSKNNGFLSPLPSNVTQNQNTNSEKLTLTIISPIDQSISSEAQTTIAGKTNPFFWVIIMGEKGEKMLQADNQGNFQTSLLLVSGENEITVTAVNDQGEKISQTLTIVYSTVEI